MTFQAIEGLQEVGEIIEPSVGVSFLFSDKTALNFSVGYEIQQLGNINFFVPGSGDVSKAVSVNMGMSF